MSDIHTETERTPDWLEELEGYTDETFSNKTRALLMGELGTGKTRLAGTFPGKRYWLNFDAGLKTVAGQHDPHVTFTVPEDMKSARKKDVYKTVVKILVELRDRVGRFDPERGEHGDVSTIIIDGYTNMAELIMAEILAKDLKDPANDKPEWDHYNMLKGRLSAITKLTQAQPYNVVATVGVGFDKDEVTGAFIGEPLILGSFRKIIGYMYDEVYLLDAKQKKTASGTAVTYECHTKPTMFFKAKSRTDLPAVIVDPTYDKLYGAGGAP